MSDGALTQFGRALDCLEDARRSSDSSARMRHLMSAVDCARAAAEQAVGVDNARYERMSRSVRHFELVRRLRVHNHHRMAIDDLPGIQMRGPITLSASGKGAVSIMTMGSRGPEFFCLEGGAYKRHDDLTLSGEFVVDPTTSQWIRIADALSAYLSDVKPYVEGVK